jgi:hypothetical protein
VNNWTIVCLIIDICRYSIDGQQYCGIDCAAMAVTVAAAIAIAAVAIAAS